MYAGHFAAGLAIKAKVPRAPTWGLLLGVGVLDLLFGPFVLAGIERVSITPGISPGFSLDYIDWSHSLVMSVVWALLYGLLFARLGRAVAIAMAQCRYPPGIGALAETADRLVVRRARGHRRWAVLLLAPFRGGSLLRASTPRRGSGGLCPPYLQFPVADADPMIVEKARPEALDPVRKPLRPSNRPRRPPPKPPIKHPVKRPAPNRRGQ